MDKIGAMDQRITFERFAETPDGGGGRVKAWAAIAKTPTVWAAVRSKAVREALEEGRMNAAYMAEFTIRNRSDIFETDRIVWNGERYNIRGIHRTGGRPLYLRIEAERGRAS